MRPPFTEWIDGLAAPTNRRRAGGSRSAPLARSPVVSHRPRGSGTRSRQRVSGDTLADSRREGRRTRESSRSRRSTDPATPSPRSSSRPDRLRPSRHHVSSQGRTSPLFRLRTRPGACREACPRALLDRQLFAANQARPYRLGSIDSPAAWMHPQWLPFIDRRPHKLRSQQRVAARAVTPTIQRASRFSGPSSPNEIAARCSSARAPSQCAGTSRTRCPWSPPPTKCTNDVMASAHRQILTG